MNLEEVMSELRNMGSEQTKKTHIAHGAVEPLFGVKVGDLKLIVKKIKKDNELSLALFETGNSDARYLAGLIADENKITKNDLNHWAENSNWQMLSEYTVPWIAAESKYGLELGKEWILNSNENIASSGWSCLSSLAAIKADEELDIPFFEECLDKVLLTIHDQPERVKYCMNGFVISVGIYVRSLTEKAKHTALQLGILAAESGRIAAKVPNALDYIQKNEAMGKIGNKRKMARC